MINRTVRGQASVMHSDVEISVISKGQLDKAVAWLIEKDYCFEYDCEIGDSLTPTKYSVRVPNMAWANNLKEFAEVLEQDDYCMEDF